MSPFFWDTLYLVIPLITQQEWQQGKNVRWDSGQSRHSGAVNPVCQSLQQSKTCIQSGEWIFSGNLFSEKFDLFKKPIKIWR